ncbi:hypothetical protein QL285_094106 [Trifolium repens]|jgi:hypothetical protein|nr:hypothetical protein QL285_094106 [Trifolium repens]
MVDSSKICNLPGTVRTKRCRCGEVWLHRRSPTSNYYQTNTDRNHQHIPLFSPATFHDPIDGIAAVLGRKFPPSSWSVPDSSDEQEKLKTATKETLTKKVHKTDQIEFSPI